jgi:hypothetical protein
MLPPLLSCLSLLFVAAALGQTDEADDLAQQRLDVMRERALSIRFRAAAVEEPCPFDHFEGQFRHATHAQ